MKTKMPVRILSTSTCPSSPTPTSGQNGTPRGSKGNGGDNQEQVVQQEQKQKKNGWGENGFEEFGGYMEAKKSKLNVQINVNNKTSAKNGNNDLGIFNGVSIYINGHTVPPEPELRKLFVVHGGTVHIYRSTKTTYVIASNLSAASKRLYGYCTVKPEWITDSISAGAKLNYRDYLLYNFNEEKNQMTLTQMMAEGQKSKLTVQSNSKSLSSSVPELQPSSDVDVSANEINGDADYNNDDDENEILPSSDDEINSSTNDFDSKGVSSEHEICPTSNNQSEPTTVLSSNTNSIMTAGRKIVKTAIEDGFLEDFFQNSRLHLISDQKKEMQNKIGKLRKAIDTHSFDFLKEFTLRSDQNNNCSNIGNQTEPVTLMHIDLDCFFVSVGLLNRPHLRGKPVVVTHSTGKGDNSNSDIASASYEARKFGVSNGMWVSEAKKLCPSLEVVPYDFEEYRRVSNTFFDTVAKITLDIEPMSVDEMVLDATSVLQKVPSASPTDLAEFIRSKIFEAVQCTASVGIGRNKLLAKLATKKAKPNGVYHLKLEAAEQYIQQLEIRELPGIGWSYESRLQDQFQVKFCRDLCQIPIQTLKQEFGVKTAEKMIQSCKGIDSAELKYGFDRPKSISVDVNYGIRFTTDDQVLEFLMKLCKELSTRAVRAQATGVNLTVKILSRKKGAALEPKKHGGHGIVDSLTRSTRLLQPTNDWNQFFRMVTKVIRLLTIPASDYRGIGMSLTHLTFEFDKSTNQQKAVQRTLFDVTTSSRGQQMLDVVRKSSNNKRDAATLNAQSNGGLVNGDSTKVSNESSGGFLVPRSPHKFSPPTPKRRRLDFGNDKTSQSKSTTVSTNAKSTPSANEDIDLNILRELPEEIAREVAQQYGIDFSSIALKLRSDPPPSLTSDGVEEVTSTASTTGNNNEQPPDGSNPYSDIDSIDPSYLCALPEAIRNEVLLQFQEAKGNKKMGPPVLGVDANIIVQEQPCSSRQALERDQILKSIPHKKPVQSTDPHYVAPVQPTDSQNELRCDEQMCDEFVYKTPPSVPSVTRSSTSQGRFRSRRSASSTPLSSKRRLDFTEKGLQIAKSGRVIDMKKFWSQKSRKQFCTPRSKSVTVPNLKDAIDVEDVRNVIREGIASIPDPEVDGMDANALTQYFHDLVDRGYLKQGQLLLKFLCRKYESLPEESIWRSIIEVIVNNSQELCLELYECELDLEL